MQSNRYISSWILYLHNYSVSTLSMLCGKLQLYFEKITELVVTGADSQLVRDAFVSLATDSGLHPLVPYFTQFVADEV
jgi:transcription initiation factor TFIID subunit 6